MLNREAQRRCASQTSAAPATGAPLRAHEEDERGEEEVRDHLSASSKLDARVVLHDLLPRGRPRVGRTVDSLAGEKAGAFVVGRNHVGLEAASFDTEIHMRSSVKPRPSRSR